MHTRENAQPSCTCTQRAYARVTRGRGGGRQENKRDAYMSVHFRLSFSLLDLNQTKHLTRSSTHRSTYICLTSTSAAVFPAAAPLSFFLFLSLSSFTLVFSFASFGFSRRFTSANLRVFFAFPILSLSLSLSFSLSLSLSLSPAATLQESVRPSVAQCNASRAVCVHTYEYG